MNPVNEASMHNYFFKAENNTNYIPYIVVLIPEM